jgi:N-glycosylase/DNA lyase
MKSCTAILRIAPEELDLDHSLTPGQSFRWRRDDRGRWAGVVGRRIIRLRREEEDVICEVLPDGDALAFAMDYFHLDVKLADLYRGFARAGGRIVEAIERFNGLRVLRQDPEETLLSYVCSAANSVPRIAGAVEAMSRLYGEFIGELDGREYHAFPTAQALAETSPDDLRRLCGLGFRGLNLQSVAAQITEHPQGWLDSLRVADYEAARAELLGIRCVGRKIADCVLLFSLDKDRAFPVDTHVRRMAVKYYLPEFRQRTLTPAVYQEIVDYFQNKFGDFAGWAQEYLFYYDLLRRPPKEETVCLP